MTKTSESIPQIFSKEIIVDSENNILTIRGDGISGSGAGLYNLTSSNISNFTNDVRNQFSAGTNITIVSGVISSVAETILSASGIDTAIQFNSGSIITGSSNLIYDYNNNLLSGAVAQFTQITGSHSGSGAGLFGIPNGGLVNSTVTVGTTNISLGGSATTIQGITVLTGSTVTGSTALFTQITAAHVSPTGSLSTPSYSFVNDPNTGIYSPGADTLAFVEGGVEVIRIDSNSRVGIGKTATIDKLEVNGSVTITGTLRISSDLEVNGGDITSTSTTFNLLNTNVSTLNIGAKATSVIFSDSTTTGSILRLNSVGAPSNLSSPQINIYNYTSSINNNVDLGMYNILADNGVGSLSTRGGVRVRYDGAAGAGKIAFVIGSAGGGVSTYTTVNTGGLSVDIGDIKINNGDLIFNTAGSGINFSSTTDGITSSNEILDDYEEGTWLPAISGTVTAGNYTYDRNGYYTKVGNLVYINMYMAVSTFTTPASGNIRITGLPFVNSSFRSSAFTVTDFRGTTTQFRLSGSSGNSGTSTSYISLWKALNANTLVSSSDFSPQTGENVLISLLGFYRTSS